MQMHIYINPFTEGRQRQRQLLLLLPFTVTAAPVQKESLLLLGTSQ